MSTLGIHTTITQELKAGNGNFMDITTCNLSVCDIVPKSSVDPYVTITDLQATGNITIGSYSFSADLLGQLLNILSTQYPELKV